MAAKRGPCQLCRRKLTPSTNNFSELGGNKRLPTTKCWSHHYIHHTQPTQAWLCSEYERALLEELKCWDWKSWKMLIDDCNKHHSSLSAKDCVKEKEIFGDQRNQNDFYLAVFTVCWCLYILNLVGKPCMFDFGC